MNPIFLVFIGIVVLGMIAVQFRWDPVWFLSLCFVSVIAGYLVVLFPIHFAWWMVSKLFGL